jgi:hypothetical protein
MLILEDVNSRSRSTRSLLNPLARHRLWKTTAAGTARRAQKLISRLHVRTRRRQHHRPLDATHDSALSRVWSNMSRLAALALWSGATKSGLYPADGR